MPWQPEVTLGDWTAEEPLFVQIARAVSEDIRRGRLSAGARLPGTRTLADKLGVHRNTVLAAYEELLAEGWLSTRQARGTYVADAMPEVRPRRFRHAPAPRRAVPAAPGFALDAPEHVPSMLPPAPRGTLVLAGGVPDLRLLPVDEIARAWRRAIRRNARTLLNYGEPYGHAQLRQAIAEMVGALRGMHADASSVLITRGSQMALDLVARGLIRRGDVVAVEALGYAPAWGALRHAGAELVSIPVDEHGLRVDALASLVKARPVRAVYVTPHHQYPTTAVLSAARRLQLLEWARRQRCIIIEDDYDHEFHYDGRPVLPLASVDEAGVVLYLGTLSKIVAPGLRLGFVMGPASVIERLASVRRLVDRQGDLVTEAAMAELLQDGTIMRHVRRARRTYHARRDALVAALQAELGERVSFQVPAGGLALWVRVHGRDVEEWAERAVRKGVSFTTARQYAFDGRIRPYVRLGFAAHDERELREAARRMRAAW